MNTKSLSAKSLGGGREGLTLAMIAGRALRSRLAFGGAFSGGLLALAGVAVGQVQGVAGEQVAAGQARFVRFGNNVTITAANNTIINYNSFNIRAGESVNFVQPDALARVLNRINSAEPSRIDGSLSANGRVYIVNPAGVYFGPGAVVNSGSIFAAAGNLSNADFLRNINRFTDVKGKVINEGTINTAPNGVAALVGSVAMNFGTISAPQGTIIMASGNNVLIGEEGGHVYAQVDTNQAAGMGPEGGQDATATQKARFGAGDTFAVAVFNKGVAKARTVQMETSRGVTVASGTIDVSDKSAGGKGGSVEILGDRVALVNATIDASGDAKGGQVLIGGDLQGKGTQRNAALANVDSKSVVHADAISSGDGGKVIVWSDDTTKFQGLITARGGAQGGDGGFVEISGAQYLHAIHNVDLSAPKGDAGTVLYDPLNIRIDGGSADGSDDTDASATNLINDSGSNTQGTISFTDEGAGTPDPFVVTESEIEGTDANIVLQARNSIQTNGDFAGDELTIPTGRNLTLETRNNGGDGAGTIDLTGSAEGAALVIRTQGVGTITINGSTDGGSAGVIDLCALTSAGGAINVSTLNGSITAQGAITGGSGGVSLLSVGDLSLQANLSAAGGTVLLQSSTGQVVQSAATAISGSTLGVRAATGISLAESGNSFTSLGAFTSGAGAPISYRDTNALNITDVAASGGFGGATGVSTTTNGTITLQTGGSLFLLNDLNSGSGAMSLTASSGTVSEGGGLVTATGTLTLSGAASFVLDAVGNDLGTVTGSVSGTNVSLTDGTGNLTLDTFTHSNGAGAFIADAVNGNITDTTSLTLAGTGSFTTEASNATITLDNLAATGAIDLHTTGTSGHATIVNSTALDVGASTLGGNLSVTADDIDLVGGAGSVTSGGGSATITLASRTAGTSIGVGTGAGSLSINATDLAGIGSFPGGLSIGNASGTAALTIGTATLSRPTTFTMTGAGGSIATTSSTTLTMSSTNLSFDAGTVSLAGAISGGGSTIVRIKSAGAVTQTAGSIVASALGVSAGGAVTLDQATNNVTTFAAFSSGSGSAISYRDSNQLTIGNVSALGTFGATFGVGTTGNGAITLRTGNSLNLGNSVGSGTGLMTITVDAGSFTDSSTGVVLAPGALSLIGGSGLSFVNLDEATNSIGTLTGSFTGTTTVVSLRDGTGSLDVAGFTHTGSGGALTLQVDNGAISDSGAMTIAGSLGLHAQTGIVLDNSLSVSGQLSLHTTGGNATIVNQVGTDLAPHINGDVTGNLSLTSVTGNITDSGGTTTVTGTGTFTTQAANADITLNEPISIGGAISLNTSGAGGNATIVNASAVDLGASGVGGNLSVTASTGNMTDSGTATVGGTGSFTTSASNATITLDQLAVTGAIDLHTTGASGNASITNASAVDLGASGVGGNLAVVAGSGAITDSGSVTIGGSGTSAFTTTGADITLDQTSAASGSLAFTTTTSGDVTITMPASTLVSIDASTVNGDMFVNADDVDFTGGNDSVGITGTLDIIPITTTREIVLGTSGAGTQLVLDDTDLDALADGIDLITVGRINSNANSTIDAFPISDPLYVRTPSGGVMTISGAVVGSGDSSLTFNTGGTIDHNGSLTVAGQNILLLATGGMDLGGDINTTGGTLRLLTGSAAGITQSAGNLLTTNLGVRAGSIDISRNGNTYSQVAAFSTGSGNALALDSDNSLTSTTISADVLNLFLSTSGISTTGGGNILVDAADLTISQQIASSGTVRLQTANGVTQSARILAGSLGVVASGAGDLILTNASNAATTVALSTAGAANTISYTDVDDVAVGSVSSSGGFTGATGVVTSNGNIVLSSGGELDIGQNITAGSGIVRLSATDTILQTSGAITASALGANSAAAGMVLASATNDVDTFAATGSGTGNAISFRDADGVSIGTVTSSGAFSGATGVAITDGNVTLRTGNTMALDQSVLTGTGIVSLTADAGGITQGAAMGVTGDSLSLNGAGTFTLDGSANAVTTLAATTTGNVTYVDTTGVDIDASTVTGNLDVTATTGNLTDSGTVDVSGTGTFTTGASNATITLNQLAVDGAISANTTGASGDVALTNATGVDLAASTIGGILDVVATTGNITDSGTVTISGAGASAFTTLGTNADITLDTTNTSAGSIGVFTTGATGDASITSSAAINLDASTLGGNLTLVSDDIDLVGGAGNVLSSGGSATITMNSLNAGTSIGVGTGAGSLSIDATDLAGIGAFFGGINIGNAAGTAALTIGDATLPLSTTFTMTGAGGSIATTGGTTLSAPGSNNLTLNAGSVSLAGTMNAGTGTVRIVSAGAVNQTAGGITATGLGVRAAGAVTLNQSNSVTTFAANSSGGGSAVQYTDASGLDLGTISALGAFSATSGVTTSNGDVLVSTGGALTIPQSISAGSGTARLASTGAVTQSGGSITAGSLGVRGGGAITLNQSSNNTGTLAATTSSGNVSYVDADALTLGSVSSSGSFAAVSGVTSAGTLSVSTPGALAINNNVTAPTSFTLSSDTDGNGGGLSFGAGVTTASPSQTFRAGNGVGSATADMLTNSPTFQGTTGGTSPTTFIVRQDGAIVDGTTAAGAQFAGGLTGLEYTLRSDNGAVTIATASKVNGSCLTLSGTSVTIIPALTLECLNTNGAITINDDLTMTEDTTFSGAVTIGGADVTISTGTGTLTFGSTVSAGANNLTLEADELQINGNVSGTGTLAMQPFTQNRPVDLAQTEGSTPGDPTAGIFDLTANEIGRVQDGFAQINIGRSNGTGAMRAVNGTVFSDPLALRMPGAGGSITVSSLMVNDGGAIFFDSPTTLSATVRTNAGVVTFNETLTVAGSSTVDTTDNGNTVTGANVVFNGDVDSSGGNNPLIVGAGTNGDVTLAGNVGDTTRLLSFTVAGRNLAILNVSTTTFQSYTGAASLSGPTTLSTGGGVTGTVDFSSTINGAQTLVIDAGTADVTINGAVGGTTPLSSFTATGGTISVNDVTTTGDQVFNGDATLAGDLASTTAGSIRLAGDTTLSGATRSITTNGGANTDDIRLTGTLDGASALTLNAGAGDVTIGGAAGGTTPLTSLAATGNTISVAGVTSTGAQTYTGATTLSGNLASTTAGAITITGNTIVTAGTQSISTAGGAASDDITITGTLDGQLAGVGTALTLNAGAGDVSITGATGGTTPVNSLVATGNTIGVAGVRTTGAQTYTGNTSTSGDLVSTNSGAIGVTGNLAVSGATRTISTEVGAISVSGTLDGASALTLDANQGDVTISGAAGGTTPLTSLAIFGQAVSVNNVTSTGAQGYTGTTGVTLNGDLTSSTAGAIGVVGPATLGAPSVNIATAGASGDDVVFDSTVDGASNLSISAGAANVAMNGVAGGSTRLQSFAVTAANTTTAGVNTTGGQTFTSNASLGGNLTSSGGGDILVTGATTLTGANNTISTAGGASDDVTLNGIEGTTADANSLVVNSGSGNTTLGAVGATTRLGALNVTGANIGAASLNSAGAITLAGTTNVTGNVSGGSLTSTGATTVGGGVTTVGDQTYTGATSVSGNVAGGAISVAGTGAFGGNVTGASIAVTGGSATIGGNATSSGTQTYSGGATITGNVQGSSLTVSGGGATIGGNASTTGAQSYAGGATVTGNVTSTTLTTGAASTFTGNVTSSGAIDLTGLSVLSGNVNGASLNVNGGSLLGNTGGARTLTFASGALFQGATTITGTTTIDAGSGPIFFASTLNSANATARDLTLLSSAAGDADTSSASGPFINTGVRFGSTVGETNKLGVLTIGGSRTSVPQAATIVMASSYVSGSNGARVSNAIDKADVLTINADQFVMGANEKLTAFGSLTINAATSATLGDITTLGDLNVNAPAITVRSRSGSAVLSQFVTGGVPLTAQDGGLDFVSGGRIVFGVAPSGFARYAVTNPATDLDIKGGSGTVSIFDGGVSEALFAPKASAGGDPANTSTELLALDMRAEGSIDNPASALASALPSDQSLGVPNQSVSLSTAIKDLLAQIGISVKDSSSFDEAVNAAAGLALYNDWPQTTRASVDDASYQVSVNRLSRDRIDSVLNAYFDLFGTDAAARNDRIAESQITLSKAMEAYVGTIGDREPDGLGFRAFIEATPEQEPALKVLNGLNKLFIAIDQLGLSPVEARVPRTTISNQFNDVGLSKEQFWAAVTGQPVAEPAPAAQ